VAEEDKKNDNTYYLYNFFAVKAVIGIGVTPIPLQQQQSAHTWTDPSPQIRSEKAPIATD
jgi:hypothetical protein